VSELVLDSVQLKAVLGESVWTERERRHAERVDRFVEPHLRRARRGEAHPVWDFLFSYYSLKPRLLRRWHPGYGVALEGASADRFRERSGYGTLGSAVTVTHDHLLARIDRVEFIADLLHATRVGPPVELLRPARVGDGLPDRRHQARGSTAAGRRGTDAVVDSMPLRCSHFDAYRFFTEPAVPRNAEPLSRQSQVASEQPGCVHANMDLYKFCGKLGPLGGVWLARGLPRPRRRCPRVGHACEPVRPDRIWFRADCHRDFSGSCRIRPPSRTSPTARRPCGRRSPDRCDLLLSTVNRESGSVRGT